VVPKRTSGGHKTVDEKRVIRCRCAKTAAEAIRPRTWGRKESHREPGSPGAQEPGAGSREPWSGSAWRGEVEAAVDETAGSRRQAVGLLVEERGRDIARPGCREQLMGQ
jgi:hypothetical protein